ncbi:ribosomal large subunit pseudouridine synthase D [Paenibacillus uliginis N3/975]|uniref:RNA pseudouridylate synthase n=1 Tax=Paenibacillus uliginis N3/975 TaxID=1313296 RepID=A0A1X7HI54_9BACL|nr:RluA family pseudouridine synthase [Paenibacillus uliginis]SMF87080.1 ribosomal large subunit pseudouridine synthase D [Paenibacillus uliginis N3/975]
MNDQKANYPDVPIVYEDNHVLGVSKPVNIPSQEDASGDADMLTILKDDIKVRYNKPGNVYLGLVHRLDRPVGGAMVFAKTSKAASRLSESVRSRSFRKLYAAIVHGKPKQPSGRLVDSLYKDSRSNTVRVVSKGTEGSKEAILDYTVLETQNGMSLVLVELHTGRPHQIRVQLSHAGWPLYGDQRYGNGLNKAGQQIALWSVFVGFPHPVSKEEIRIESMPPTLHPWNLFPSGRLIREIKNY